MRILLTCCFLSLLQWLNAQEFYVKFPNDTIISECNYFNNDFGAPVLYNPSGLNIDVSYTDQFDNDLPDACFRIERTWLIKAPGYNPQLPCTLVPNPGPDPLAIAPENLPGPIVSPAGTAAPWAPTVVKIVPQDPSPTNYSIFWSASANCYTYKQWIWVIDKNNPVLDPASVPFAITDTTTNDPGLWNAPYWYDPGSGLSDLPEIGVSLTAMASDACWSSGLGVKYYLSLDLNQDGIPETFVHNNGLNLPPGQVRYNNNNNAPGTLRYFDTRPIPEADRYQFVLVVTKIGNQQEVKLMWTTANTPGVFVEPQLPPGKHQIAFEFYDGCGNTSTYVEEWDIVAVNPANQHLLHGTVRQDENLNCLNEPTEAPAGLGWRSRLEYLLPDNTAYAVTFSTLQADSSYRFWVDTGAYRVAAIPPNVYWGVCQPPLEMVVTENSADSTRVDFAATALVDCPFLETDIGIWGLRRCFNNTYTVKYCNTGTAPAEDAYIVVDLDPAMSFVSAGKPAENLGNNQWKFLLGELPLDFCDQFPLTVYLDCNSTVLGQTHCVTAHIYPDSFCLNPTSWSGANVELDGNCDSTNLFFRIKNTGLAPMTQMLDYVVIEDNIINLTGSFQLNPGEEMVQAVPANGSTWRLEAEQEPGNPYNNMPSITIEGCGQNSQGGISTGFVSQFGESDNEPAVSTDCMANIGSYDPNDKQGFPLGYGPKHQIEPGQALEYLIRFQNTGTDTAFRVIIRDTLSAWLDWQQVQPGVSSHPYRFEMGANGAIAFVFDNILLPDSNVNEAASNGFVKFRVAQQAEVPLKSFILNQAAIYFDFNPPVITNQTSHQVGVDPLSVGLPGDPGKEGLPMIAVYPNPALAGSTLIFELPAGSFGVWADCYDIHGKLQCRKRLNANRPELNLENMPSGLYYFRLFNAAGAMGTAKVLLR